MCHVQLTIWTRYRNSAQVAELVAQFVRDYGADEYNIKIIKDVTKVQPAKKVEFVGKVSA